MTATFYGDLELTRTKLRTETTNASRGTFRPYFCVLHHSFLLYYDPSIKSSLSYEEDNSLSFTNPVLLQPTGIIPLGKARVSPEGKTDNKYVFKVSIKVSVPSKEPLVRSAGGSFISASKRSSLATESEIYTNYEVDNTTDIFSIPGITTREKNNMVVCIRCSGMQESQKWMENLQRAQYASYEAHLAADDVLDKILDDMKSVQKQKEVLKDRINETDKQRTRYEKLKFEILEKGIRDKRRKRGQKKNSETVLTGTNPEGAREVEKALFYIESLVKKYEVSGLDQELNLIRERFELVFQRPTLGIDEF
eukprot:snap_masked-scaffold_34-processed-gene-1.60-mRNA-1 protein AED:1.00 eAED:1.00 QI:0/-1/0/0/-1/1/1/0/307